MNHPPMLNIANILASRGEGGLETHFVQLCNGLTDHANVTAIAHPEFAPRLDSAVRFLPLDTSRSRRNPVLIWQLLRLLRDGRFDIIHAQANKAVELTGSVRRFVRAPLIGTLHNQKHQARMFRRMDHVIAVSKAAAEIVESVPTTVIYNGLPKLDAAEIELRAMFDLPAERPVLVAVGRLVRAKGFDVLIDAVSPLEVSVLIAGDGPDAAHLHKQVRTHDMKAHIRLIGHRNDVTNLINASDGVVISSRREGFSYVAAETLLLGRRLLATDVPVANEVLPRELIVPTEDAAALRERLRVLLADPDRWSDLAAPAAAFAREHFTIDAMVRQTADLYASVAVNRSA